MLLITENYLLTEAAIFDKLKKAIISGLRKLQSMVVNLLKRINKPELAEKVKNIGGKSKDLEKEVNSIQDNEEKLQEVQEKSKDLHQELNEIIKDTSHQKEQISDIQDEMDKHMSHVHKVLDHTARAGALRNSYASARKNHGRNSKQTKLAVSRGRGHVREVLKASKELQKSFE